jgi:uncharacterized membrane protein
MTTSAPDAGPAPGRAATGPLPTRMAVAVLALLGLLIALYLLLYKLGVFGVLLCGEGGCETVQQSSYAVFLGLPVPGWGVLGYGALLALASLGAQGGRDADYRIARGIVGLAWAAFAFTVYLNAVEAFVLHAWCRWCLGSAAIATLIFLLSFAELPRLRRE